MSPHISLLVRFREKKPTEKISLHFGIQIGIAPPKIALNKIGPHQLKFTYLLEEHGLVSVHNQATTSKGNLVDLVLMNKDVSFDLNIDKTLPSDHYAITFNMVIEKVTREKIPCEEYEWKSVNHFEFAESFMLFFDEIISLEMIQKNSIKFISLEMGSEEVFNFVNKLFDDCFYLSAISIRNKLVPFKRFLVLSNRPRYFGDERIPINLE